MLIDGEDTAGVPGHELRRRIGYAIQGHGLFPHRTVAENIATVPSLLGWPRARIDARVEELLDLFQLPPAEFAPKFPHQLSGGQQQRVGVARALAAEPNILLMDEPFGALDAIIRGRAQDDLLAIQRRFKTTIVLVTHDMEEAFRLGNRIAVLSHGNLLQYAEPAAIVLDPADAFVARLTGAADRAYRLLSLATARDALEHGAAEGPDIHPDTSLREVLAETRVDRGGRPAGRRWRPTARPRDAPGRTGAGSGQVRGVIPTALRLAALALLVSFLLTPQSFAPLFAPLTSNGAPPIYTQSSMLSLAWSHLLLVFGAAVASTLLAVGLGIFVTRPAGAEFLPLSRAIVNIGQTFPPVAVLALAVPVVGFGGPPTLLALFLYGLLPIFENTLSGLAEVPADVLEAARGMGMSDGQRLLRVELPLALPVILEGIRLSVVINLGTATIGSTVAAKSLGEVIIAGLLSGNTAFILQGGLVVGLMAVLLYDGMNAAEGGITRYLGLPPRGAA